MKKKTPAILIWVLVLGLTTVQGQDRPSFINTIAVGDSLTAGFQNNSLSEKGQVNSYTYFIAQQVGTYMFLPLIASPGIPNELVLKSGGPPPLIETASGASKGRTFPLIVVQNLAVPGHTTLQALTVRPDTKFDGLEDLILGLPSLVIPLGIPPLSQVEMAFALKPTFTILWLGNNEVLGAAVAADAGKIVSFDVFQQAYKTAVGTILATGSKLIVANVPDVTSIAYLSSAEQVAALAGAPLAAIGPLLGIEAGDFVTAPGLSLVTSILTGKAKGPLSANVVLTASEVAAIRTATAAMNAFIQGLSQLLNFPVADIHKVLNDARQNGYLVGNIKLTTGFLGGIFSLDGVHPTNTGNAIAANAFIDKMNEFYGLKIPRVDVAKVMAADPLVLNKSGKSDDSPVLMSMSEEAYRWLASVLVPGLTRRGGSLVDRGQDPELLDGRFLQDWLERWSAHLPQVTLAPGPFRLQQERSIPEPHKK